MIVMSPGTEDVPADEPYIHSWRSMRHANHLRFAVLGCSDARLLLSSRTTGFTEGMLEIRIGTKDNTM